MKKNAQTKLTLAFRTDPSGAKVHWRLTCEGLAITGWDSKPVLSITERQGRGAIQTIEGHDFVGSNPAVTITLKRPKALSGASAARTASMQGHGFEKQERTIAFELR